MELFLAIKKRPKVWDDVNNSLLPKNNCFRALIRFLRDKYPLIAKADNNYILTVENFKTLFLDLEISDEDFDSSKGIFPGVTEA